MVSSILRVLVFIVMLMSEQILFRQPSTLYPNKAKVYAWVAVLRLYVV